MGKRITCWVSGLIVFSLLGCDWATTSPSTTSTSTTSTSTTTTPTTVMEDDASDYVFGILPDDTYGVVEYIGSKTVLVIPSSYLDKNVTYLGRNAFLRCSSITNITIPSTVKWIDEYAFAFCSGILGITIPSSVTVIDENAFFGCSSMTSVTFEGVSQLVTIGPSAFAFCSRLTSITIPSSVTDMWPALFAGCSSLTHFMVDEKNPSYSSEGGVLFDKQKTAIWAYPAGKTNSAYVIGSNVRYIQANAFDSCSHLTSVVIPASVILVNVDGFHECGNLTIYAEAPSEPDNWADDWNPDNRPVVWGYGS